MKRPVVAQHSAPGKLRILLAAVVGLLIVLATLVAGKSEGSAHADRNYAIIRESSAVYIGAIARINHYNPDLGTGSFTNSTLWVADTDTCGGAAWVEAGWSKRSSWGGQLRHKFMWQVAPTCTFAIWPFNLGSPSSGQLYEYRVVYNSSENRWDLYIDGLLRAAKVTGFVFADIIDVGGELAPNHNGTIQMGPSNAQQLQYRVTGGAWVDFYYEDYAHCDIDPPLLPFNLVHPANSPTWIYFWGPAAGGYCP